LPWRRQAVGILLSKSVIASSKTSVMQFSPDDSLSQNKNILHCLRVVEEDIRTSIRLEFIKASSMRWQYVDFTAKGIQQTQIQ